MNRKCDWFVQLMIRLNIHRPALLLAICVFVAPLRAQMQAAAAAQFSDNESPQSMEERITRLEAEVAELRSVVKELLSASSVSITAASFLPAALHSSNETAVKSTPFAARQNQDNAMQVQDRKVLDFFRDTTINLGIDTYYAYNFNQPVGRVNLLRAYDVLSNEFSLNQASVIFEHAPDVAAGRRWGGRLDLQYGQATDTLQGNPANEPRPDIYRNIFQAYGTYIIGLGKGVNVDFGKWSQRGERDELKYLSTEEPGVAPSDTS